MEELVIIDYQTADEKNLTNLVSKYNGIIDDWVERDYGLKLFARIPAKNISNIKSEINDSTHYSYDI